MDKNVAGRDGGGFVGVGVRDADEADAAWGRWWLVGRASEEEEDVVDMR